jgi:Domain of unknown function (DUF397)
MAPTVSDACWFKSSASSVSGCVEVAFLPERQVGVRDSRSPAIPPHVLSGHAWMAFLARAKKGDYDLPAGR